MREAIRIRLGGRAPARLSMQSPAVMAAAAGLLAVGVAAGAGRLPAALAGLLAAGAFAAILLHLLGLGRMELEFAKLCEPDAVRGVDLARAVARLTERLSGLAHRMEKTHPVTGLPTREVVCATIAADAKGGSADTLLAVLRFVDFDRLSAFDQSAADEALKRFARRLAAATRPIHTVGQVDRDCFCVWFRGGLSLEAATTELKALAYVASQELALEGETLTPTVEVGSAIFPRDGCEGAQLLVRATVGLARPKVSSIGELTVTAPRPMTEVKLQFDLEQDLARAIAEDQLRLVYQPLVCLSARRVVGAEALLRWTHPRLGEVPPARFVPVMEAVGLSDRYGLWVLNTACREARRWRDCGLEGVKVAVNLSAHQLLDPRLASKVARTLERNRLDPTDLELELTETAAMADAGRTRQAFAQLREMGVALAIDDFGAGYSSLSYLKNLPFDKLKIDREFVTAVQARADSRAICRALIELGRGLELRVLAEGVETPAEVEAMAEMGCDLFQGYHFARPLEAAAFVDFARHPERLQWPTTSRAGLLPVPEYAS